MKKLIALLILLSAVSLFAQTNLPVGTVRKPIITDASGNVISTNIVFSNQVVMAVAPTASNHLARIMDVTNSTVFVGTNNTVFLNAITNVVNGGTGTGLIYQVTGRVGYLASLVPGNGITFTNSGGTNITIHATAVASSGAQTNAINVWTAPQIMAGASNVFGYSSGSTNIFGGATLIGTNSYGDTGALVVLKTSNGKNGIDILDDMIVFFGDPFTSSYSYVFQNGTTYVVNNNAAGAISLRKANVEKIAINTSSITIGDNSSYGITMNNGSIAIPNGINIGSGQWIIPTVGVLTNTGPGMTTLGTNNANAYAVKGVLGFSGSVTNLGPGLGSSNIVVFCDGIVTNKFTIP